MGFDKLFSDFAENNQATDIKKRSRSVTVNYRGGVRNNKPITGAASNVTRYIYKDGECIGIEIIKVRARR